MQQALANLAWLRFRAALRKRYQQLKTLRGLAYFVLSVVVLGFLLFSRSDLVASSLTSGGGVDPTQLRLQTATWLPVSLLLMCLYTTATATGPAFHLSATERNFLVPAPVSRRSILLYKFGLFTAGTLLSALLIALLVPPHGISWSIFFGTFFTFTFAQLFSVVANLGFSKDTTATAKAPSRCRWLLGLLLAVVVVYGVLGLLSDVALSERLRSDPFVQFVTLPFVPFARVLTANTAGMLFSWGALTLGINLSLLVLVLWLDSVKEPSFDEVLPSKAAKTRQHDFRRVDRLFQLNPIIAQQYLHATRHGGRRLLLFLISMPFLGPFLIAPRESMDLWTQMGLLFVVAAYILPRSMVYDFRSDISKVSHFKSLPLSPWKICVGQLAIPTLLSSLCLWLLILGALPWIPDEQRMLTLQLALFVPLANALLFASDNLLFLLFPRAHVPSGRVDFDFMGRAMIELFAKTCLLLATAAAALFAGIQAVQALGVDTGALLAICWFVTAAVLVLMVLLLGRALAHYEPR